ncbi:hypothetical protein [Halosimplex pelagicum]|uniref:AbrB/MazE/SpoVT family DNA-binding domain-containing protein n=1 Tax=Halosimplex pelagicum TaxID=869886 RepID=A0A7D5SWK0_9EURY|nr:hypothetical protein [Halosimplex pelagicum]QLH83227.1 hypothetical protein HZS54_17020 [Halosimplex pelagicum]
MSGQKQYSRTVTAQGPGTLGTSLPAGFVNEFGIEKGDELKIEDLDWDDGTITFRV